MEERHLLATAMYDELLSAILRILSRLDLSSDCQGAPPEDAREPQVGMATACS